MAPLEPQEKVLVSEGKNGPGKEPGKRWTRGGSGTAPPVMPRAGPAISVSPPYVGKGFINGHMFSAQPHTIDQCMACHGSRIGNEFSGIRGQGDVHVQKYTMVCKDCTE